MHFRPILQVISTHALTNGGHVVPITSGQNSQMKNIIRIPASSVANGVANQQVSGLLSFF